jgi:Transmembrane secretion effector
MASATPSSRPLGQVGAALAVPNFRRYVGGQSLSLIGTWVETVAQGLLVLRLTHSAVMLGLTTAARYGPILVLSPYAGLLVDRLPKRRVLLVTQAGLGVVSLLLGLAVLSGIVRLWQVFVLAVAFGTFSAADNPARQAFVSEVVGPSLVRNAVTLNATLVNVARVIGPTIAGVVVGSAGRGPPLPRAGDGLVVDGPGRQHADRFTDCRRPLGRLQRSPRGRDRGGRMRRGRGHRQVGTVSVPGGGWSEGTGVCLGSERRARTGTADAPEWSTSSSPRPKGDFLMRKSTIRPAPRGT